MEGVGTGNTAWTLVSLLTVGVDVFSLMTTFEGPGADVSLIAFKVVRMFLSITTICYKTDRTNRCLSLPFLSKGVSWKSSSLASKAVFLNKFACVYANRERNPRSTANGHLIYVISTIHLTYLSLYFALPLEAEGHRLSFASYWSKEKKKGESNCG